MEFIDSLTTSINGFLYSPLGIGIQVFSGILCVSMILLRWKMFQDTGDIARPIGEIFSTWLNRGNKNQDNTQEASQQNEVELDDLARQWQEIEAKMDTYDENQWKLAIIEADNLLDQALMRMGVQGNSLGERMRSMDVNHYPFINDAWKAHRVRNYLVHDSSYHLSARTVGETYNHYRRVFVDIGVVKNN